VGLVWFDIDAINCNSEADSNHGLVEGTLGFLREINHLVYGSYLLYDDYVDLAEDLRMGAPNAVIVKRCDPLRPNGQPATPSESEKRAQTDAAIEVLELADSRFGLALRKLKELRAVSHPFDLRGLEFVYRFGRLFFLRKIVGTARLQYVIQLVSRTQFQTLHGLIGSRFEPGEYPPASPCTPGPRPSTATMVLFPFACGRRTQRPGRHRASTPGRPIPGRSSPGTPSQPPRIELDILAAGSPAFTPG